MRNLLWVGLLPFLTAAALGAQSWQGPAELGIRVTDEAGRPLPGAVVVLRHEAGGGPEPTATDARGQVLIEAIAPGEWNVEVRREGYMIYSAFIRVETGEVPTLGFSSRQRTGTFWEPIEVALFQPGLPAVTTDIKGKKKRQPADSQKANREKVTREEQLKRQAAGDKRVSVATLIAAEPSESEEPSATPPQPAPAPEPSPQSSAPPAVQPGPATAAPRQPELPSEAGPGAVRPPATEQPATPEPVSAAPRLAAVTPAAAEVSRAPAIPVAPASPAGQEAKTEPAPGVASAPAVPELPAATPPQLEEPTPPMPQEETAPVAPSVVEPEPQAVVAPVLSSAAAGTPAAPEEPSPPRVHEEPPAPPVAAGVPEPMPTPQPVPTPVPPEEEQPAPEPSAEPGVQPPVGASPPPAPAVVPPAAATPPPALEAAPVLEALSTTAPPPPPTAPPSIPTLRRSSYLRSGGTCPECKTREWAVSSVREAAASPAAAAERGRCPADAEDRMRELSELLFVSAPSSLAGPLAADGGGDALSVLDPASRSRAEQLLAPFKASSCQLLAVVLPKSARFVGFRYEAQDSQGGGDCLPQQDCPVGQASWPSTPRIERSSAMTVAYSLFRNDAEDRQRRATFTVYFVPSRSWVPPTAQ